MSDITQIQVGTTTYTIADEIANNNINSISTSLYSLTTSLSTMAFQSDAPVDSKTYGRNNGSWVEIAPKIYYYTVQTVSVATNAQIMRIPSSGTDDKITTDTVVLECTFADPSKVTSNVNWTSYAGYITFSGTCFAATTADVTLGTKGN